MAEMKDSGIEWCGKIPISWNVMPNKYVMHKRKEICPKYSGEDILSLTMDGVIVRDLDAGGKMPASFDGYQRVHPHNLLMCLFDYDVTPRCIGLIQNEGLTSPAYSQFVMKNGNDARYYYYYYLMIDNTKELLHLAKNLRHSFTEDQLGIINTPVPPVEIQKQIAKYLDQKCEDIDAVYVEIEKQIETLEEYKKSIITEAVTKGLDPDVEMKDSGIEWIGMIPKHWNVTKFKYICSVKTNLVNVKKYQEYPQISPDNIEKDSGILLNYSTVAEAGVISDNHLFFKGQILYSKIRPKLNKATIAPFNGLCSADMYPIETNENTMFVMYMILSQYFLNQVSLVTEDRVKMPKINQEELGVIKIVLPDNINEQEKIVLYLHQKCQDISKAIEEKKEQLETLEQYKKSIIYEYVTGKKEVK